MREATAIVVSIFQDVTDPIGEVHRTEKRYQYQLPVLENYTSEFGVGIEGRRNVYRHSVGVCASLCFIESESRDRVR